MDYHVDGYLDGLYQKRNQRFNIDTVDKVNIAEYRNGMKSGFIECLGDFPAECPLNISYIEDTQMDGYRRLKFTYDMDARFQNPAYLLLPDHIQQKCPVVVAFTGHGHGAMDLVGLCEDGILKSEKGLSSGYQKDFPIELVKRGLIVLVPELLGFGELMLTPNPQHRNNGSSCFMISPALLMYRRTMAAMRIWQGKRMIDFIASYPNADSERVGVMGISGGGLVAGYLAAVDERVKVCVASGFFCSFKESIMSIAHCIDNYLPGILDHGENGEIFGLIAPRPLLIEAGTADDIFPIEAVKSEYNRLAGLYGRLGAAEMLDIDIFEGEHQISGAKAYDFLIKHLHNK